MTVYNLPAGRGKRTMRDGTLSGAEFQSASMEFLRVWNSRDISSYQWNWQTCTDSTAQGYLTLEDVPLHHLHVDDHGEEQLEENDRGNNCTDAATLVMKTHPAEQYSYGTYHIVYSESYRVPVLFFRAYYPDGKLLDLAHVKRILPSQSVQLMEESKWTFLTQEEHPYLHRPWFSLHPCGTSCIMSLFLSDEGSKGCVPELDPESRQVEHMLNMQTAVAVSPDASSHYSENSPIGSVNLTPHVLSKYLLTWLSFVGPVVRLSVPLSLFKPHT